MHMWFRRFMDAEDATCRCECSFSGAQLTVESAACPGRGALAEAPDCRATVIEALEARDVAQIKTQCAGQTRTYREKSAAALVAAGRFAAQIRVHDERLAERTRTDPLRAAHDAAGRADPVARIAAETGLLELCQHAESYDDLLRPVVGLSLAHSRVTARPPPEARLCATKSLDTGTTIRRYEQPTAELDTYHVEPAEYSLEPALLTHLDAAIDTLASGSVGDGPRAPRRAVQAVVSDPAVSDTLAPILRKHTRGYGVLEDLFADTAVSDVFATAPVSENALRVRVGGDICKTNVFLSSNGAAALASRLRRESGRTFSRASPTLDAVAKTNRTEIRVAGVTEPVSDGTGFVFRAHGREPWTLAALVGNGTLSANAAALLSVAVERGATGLIAGGRGAGKTALLGALLWELPAATRTVLIEDTPELPVSALQAAGRDVQALHVSTDDETTALGPTDALRTALRLGDGALVIGEVRGEEAAALYEAMRVGAGANTVLGTIHGDGAAAVKERVVTDLNVPESSFGATDLVVTLRPIDGQAGRTRRVVRIEEVVARDGTTTFYPLFERGGRTLEATGRIDRGSSQLVASLATATESYSDVRACVETRKSWFEELVANGQTTPEQVVAAHARRRVES
ncbi:type II/IV secretion system ATPase subunit [Haladaptatus sp. DJG-WS-42]|uniref:type II/IV secretion system ATPase subunit n=1 Tax=Haladaptatus sp. DJG-WS-42 TaxID=3120516 RepID=UPI0030D3D45D